jgi:hypothetical protein
VKNLTKLKISAHTLLIEKGRYFRPKLCRNLRLCSLCNKIEDEEHAQQENADSIKLQINLVSDILLGFISLLNVDEVVSLSFCKVERSRFRFENRLDLKGKLHLK